MTRVYVSSTLADLQAERQAVMEWLVAAGHEPVQSYRPDSDTVRDSCLDDVAGCDLYVVIVGHRYGFQPESDNPEHLSITHLEFRRAKESGVPRVALIRTSVPAIRQSDLLDPQRARLLLAFQEEVRREVRPAEFSDLHGLIQGLSTGVQAELDKRRSLDQNRVALGRWTGPVVSVPPLTGLEVARPGLAADIVAALTGDNGSGRGEPAGVGAVGSTTRVTGATGGGGFGKTSLARLVAHDRRVLDHYVDGVVWVTIGEDAQGPLLAEKVNEVTALLSAQRPPLTDPVAAGSLLGKILAGRRLLLVVDDVWSSGQLQPFLQATQSRPGRDANPAAAADQAGLALLVTSRRVSVLPEGCRVVTVDAMAEAEAEQLLTRGLPGVPAEVVERLLRLTGRWPVLLGLVNGAARADVQHGVACGQALSEVADQISADGPDVLDLADNQGRDRGVGATLRASLDRLTTEQQARYFELAVFGVDVDIPRQVLERYWAHTAGWRPGQVRQLCALLLDLGLAAEYRLDGNTPRMRLHDVIRAWLRHRTPTPVVDLDRALVGAHRAVVAEPDREGGPTPWWRLPTGAGDPVADYLWAWLPRHLAAAGSAAELTAMLQRPEWILGKLTVLGPAALESDLLLSDNPACQALARVVRQDGHLLDDLDPPGSLAATLASRCSNTASLTGIRTALLGTVDGPHLEHVGQVPDFPHPNLYRVLTGHTGRVTELVVGPDGTWLASAGGDGTVRVWDTDTGWSGAP